MQCFSGLEWLNDNKNEFGISNICVAGESGGGNLAIATGAHFLYFISKFPWIYT